MARKRQTDGKDHCDFCGRTEEDGVRLLGNTEGMHICSACIAQAYSVLNEYAPGEMAYLMAEQR